MKKIYILASALVLTGTLTAQKINADKLPVSDNTKAEIKSTSKTRVTKKAPGDVFWYEDFTNGVGGNSVDGSGNSIGGAWTRGSDGATDFSLTWAYSTTGVSRTGWNYPINSETRSNGFMIFDAWKETDAAGGSANIIIDGWLESPVIDISGYGTSALGLEIQQNYMTCCSGSVYPINIFVGYEDALGDIIWTEKNSGNALKGHNQYEFDGSGFVPEVRLMNIADVAQEAVNAGTNIIKLRFHFNRAINPSNDFYWWMIDDVRVKEIFANDSKLAVMYTGDIVNDFEYYAIPEGQITNYPAIVGGLVQNMGALQLTNVNLDVTITNDATSSQVHQSSSPGINLNAGAEQTIWYNTNFIPTDLGVYTVEISSAHNEVDQQPADNTLSKKFALTEFEYGHYNPNSSTLTWDLVNSGANPGRAMQSYIINEDATIYGMYIYLQNGTGANVNTVDQIAQISIRDEADAVSIIRSQEFTVCSNCINKVFPIRFDNPLNVFAGDFFYASLDAFGGGDVMVVALDENGDSDFSSLVDVNGTIYLGAGDYFVNLSFDPNIETLLSLNDIKNNNGLSLMQNIPNPATFSTEIRYALGNTANVTLEVVDVTGKVIAKHALGMRAAGDHSYELNTSDFADGIYYYTLTAGSDRLSNKMVVRK
jgi:hypothetical protein